MTRPAIRGVLTLIVLCSSGPAFAQRGTPNVGALVEAGEMALEARRFGEALDAFTEASRLLPRDPGVKVGAAVAAFMLGRHADAEVLLQAALKLPPRLLEAYQVLGQVQYRDGRLREAIATYEEGLKVFPRASELQASLTAWRAEAARDDRSYSSTSAHFAVMFEGAADDAVARRIVEYLEDAYWKVGAALNTYPSRPVTVVLYTDQDYRDVTRAPAWSAAFYDGRIRLPVRGAPQQSAELERILKHEYAHAVVAMLGGGNVPTWVNEGLATALEREGTDWAAEMLARGGARPTLRSLHGSFADLPAADARMAYAVSAHAVSRMLQLRGAPAVVELLKDLGRGAEFASAFQQRLAVRYDDFEAQVGR